jgi:hypothetical protein
LIVILSARPTERKAENRCIAGRYQRVMFSRRVRLARYHQQEDQQMHHRPNPHRRIRVGVATLAAGLSLVAAVPAAQARVLRGTVVHHNSRAHSFAVADRRGELFAVHARHSPRIGSKVTVTARRLRNGTFAAQHVRANGRQRNVRVHGTVTFVNRRHGVFALSADGISMLVHRARRDRGADDMPAIGTEVTATGTVDDRGDLDDQSVQDGGADTNGIKLEGTVLSIDPTARTLTISADDDDASGGTVLVSVPATFDLSQFNVGEEVELNVVPQGTGFVLQGAASDDGVQGADDQGEEQGDMGENHDSGGDGGTSSGSDSSGSGSGSSDGTH